MLYAFLIPSLYFPNGQSRILKPVLFGQVARDTDHNLSEDELDERLFDSIRLHCGMDILQRRLPGAAPRRRWRLGAGRRFGAAPRRLFLTILPRLCR